MNPLAYWARILKGIYFPNSSFLLATRGSHASWVWLSLLHGRGLLEKGLRWHTENGASINFWVDGWIPTLEGFKLQSVRPPNTDIQLVGDVIVSGKGWNIPKLAPVISHLELQAIQKIPLPCLNRRDRLIWHHSKNGVYSVKSGYHIATNLRAVKSASKPGSSFQPGANLWRTIWKLKIPNKIKNFWWRVCRNGLATKENLFRRKCAQSNICPICNLEVESIEHLLFFCPWARAVWFGCNVVFEGIIGRPNSTIKWTAHILESMSKPTAMLFFEKDYFYCLEYLEGEK
ncbi:hypothetical protein RHGRI_037069 [Rhododendron griersonianum]|nr:hypothetical protein RHGRI_037069 [Rhododendron griersonianum]